MYKIVDGKKTELAKEEIKQLEKTQKEYEAKEKHRPLTQEEVFMLFCKQNISALAVDDNTALRIKTYYPTFKEIIGQTIEKKGFKFTYKDELFKTMQDNLTIQEHYPPEPGTESLYARIDEEHEGTEYDPIPYKGNMSLAKDKYYTQYGVMYPCFRDTGIEVHQTLAELVDVYVNVIEKK